MRFPPFPRVVPLLLAAAVGVCAWSCGGSPTSPSSNPPGDASAADLEFCLTETNAYRAQVGREPLVRDAGLDAFALEAARSDGRSRVAHEYWASHAGGGSAENEVIGWQKAIHGLSVRGVIRDAIAGYWGEGSNGGHYRNLTGGYTRLGCGVYVNGDAVTFVQDFR